MKILVILNDLDIGGAQNYTIGLMNEFVKIGHSVSLRVLSEKLLLKERLHDRIDTIVWPRKHKIDINILWKIRKEVVTGKYDGIISSYTFYQKTASFMLKNNPTTIYPIHTTIERGRKSFLINYFAFKLKRINEIYLTSIDSQTDYLTKIYHLEKNYFHQIYNGIDVERYSTTPENFVKMKFLKRFKINPEHKIILMLAGFREEKRHIDAIDAFKILKKEISNVSLVFVGDNRIDEMQKLKQYAGDYDNNIKFLLASDAGDVRNFYWSADVFTLTSDKVETFPISSLEAMSTGLPCVLTNIGGAKDFIQPNMNGLLCEVNNAEDIKSKWLEILNNLNHYNKWNIRNNIVEKYSIQRSANEYLRLIENYRA